MPRLNAKLSGKKYPVPGANTNRVRVISAIVAATLLGAFHLLAGEEVLSESHGSRSNAYSQSEQIQYSESTEFPDTSGLHIPSGYKKYIDAGVLRVRGDCYYIANPVASGSSVEPKSIAPHGVDSEFKLISDVDSSCNDPHFLGFPDSSFVANTFPYPFLHLIAESDSVTYSLFYEGTWLIFCRSLDQGSTWIDSVHLYTVGWFSNPDMAVVDSFVYVVWDNFSPSNNAIYFRRSTDYGWRGPELCSGFLNVRELGSGARLFT